MSHKVNNRIIKSNSLSFSINIPIININNNEKIENNNSLPLPICRSNSYQNLKYPPLSPSNSLNNSTNNFSLLKPLFLNNNNNCSNNNSNNTNNNNVFVEEIFDTNNESDNSCFPDNSTPIFGVNKRTLSPLHFNNSNNSFHQCPTSPNFSCSSPSVYSSYSPVYPSSPIQNLYPPLSPSRLPSSPNSLNSSGSFNLSSLNINDKNEFLNTSNNNNDDDYQNELSSSPSLPPILSIDNNNNSNNSNSCHINHIHLHHSNIINSTSSSPLLISSSPSSLSLSPVTSSPILSPSSIIIKRKNSISLFSSSSSISTINNNNCNSNHNNSNVSTMNTVNKTRVKGNRRHISKTMAHRNSLLLGSASNNETATCNIGNSLSNNTAENGFSCSPEEKIFFCDHIGCDKGFSSPQSRSNHYSLKHNGQCQNYLECPQCLRVLKIKTSPKSKCRHFGCEKICSSANLAKHEKTCHHKNNYSERFSCSKCDDLSTQGYNNALPSISDLTNNKYFPLFSWRIFLDNRNLQQYPGEPNSTTQDLSKMAVEEVNPLGYQPGLLNGFIALVHSAPITYTPCIHKATIPTCGYLLQSYIYNIRIVDE